MGAIEFFTYMTGKVLTNIVHVKQKSSHLEDMKKYIPVLQFSSTLPLQEICSVMLSAFK
jgi:hypothetical protein